MWNTGTIRWGKRYFAGGRKFFYISKVLETQKKLGTIYGDSKLAIITWCPILLKEVKYYDISFFWWYCVYLQRFHACWVCVDSMVTRHVSLNFASIFFSLSLLAAGSTPGGWLVMIVTCGIIILSAQRRGSRASNEDSRRLHNHGEGPNFSLKVPTTLSHLRHY